MKFNPQIHHRRSIRLQKYDYSQAGVYFVTIVAYQRECLFGEIVDGEMILNNVGKIIQKWWDEIPNHFPNVETGAFIIMPNHVHGIIIIIDDRRGTVPVPRYNPNSNPLEIPQPGLSQGQAETSTEEDGETLENQGGETPPLRKRTLGQIVAYFKYQSTKELNALDGSGVITKFWQRNYYEHIIRNEREMDNIWRYIEANPSAWEEDEENPRRVQP